VIEFLQPCLHDVPFLEAGEILAADSTHHLPGER
jgi:hypothetical protein